MESIWSQTCQLRQREALPGDMKTDIAVIGAGMAGILIASALQGAGRRVVVLEAKRIAGGQTRNTTAKLTCQHGLLYEKLIRTLGEEKARQYAQANAAALMEYRRIIADRNIDCELEQRDACVYGSNAAQLRKEAEAAAALGLPAFFVEETKLPFPTAGAVCFANQAQFHPLKFLQTISEPLTIYENTSVQSVEENQLITTRGRVQAEQIVFACHYPFVNFPGMYFARMHQERSYVIALENAARMDGMWIGAEQGAYSFRNYGPLLLLGGGGHRCGENSAGGRYDLLRQQAARWFPGSREVAHWSAQDCVTADSVPYIGPYAASRPNWYVATGFQKWGMTSSMVAAMLLRDRICGKENPWAEVFDPGRFDEKTLTGLAQESVQAVKGLAKQLFQIPAEAAKELTPGHGGIVFWKGKKLGVYKDESGTLWPVDIRCPHLGCQLEWNPDERSWDCPCHGSRFDYRGKLISGPAQENITIQT
ncbi:MAG: FAD-dependent oxidoreductase [Oscillospiraceae bacterium]|nr:FAD-dependent oxidoreductase [Oscillospiraceae bacterium]